MESEAARLEYREYIRNYMRRRRGCDHLVDLEIEAESRGMTVKALSRRLLDIIVADDLFAAILD